MWRKLPIAKLMAKNIRPSMYTLDNERRPRGVVPYVKAIFLAFLSLAAACASGDRFDDFVQAKMADEQIPGLQFAVVYKGKVVMSRAYGLADIDKKAPVTKDTDFEIASSSKPIIATAVMMLWEQGKFRLEEPVGKYVAEIPLSWSRVPIQNLLSHTSGVPEFRGGPLFAKHRMEDTPLTEIAKSMSDELLFDVGDHFAYSNTNYVLLGKLIEAVTGKPYTEYLQAQIFDPLGMTATGFVGKKEHAQGYYAMARDYLATKDCSLAWAGAGAGIVSTAEDIAKFDIALQNQKLVKNGTLARMLEPTATRLGIMDYGLGWQVGKIGNSPVALHQGEMNGFSSMILRIVNEKISVILLTNASAIDGNTLTRGILGLYFPELDPAAPLPIVDTEPDTTHAHQRVLQSIAQGEPDMDAFTEDYKVHVGEEKLKAMGAELKRGGRIQPLQVLRRFKKGNYDVHSYLMTQGKTQMIITFMVDDKGKIGGLTITAP